MLASAAALALAGCASGVRKPETPLPVAYEAPAGTQALDTRALDRWWTIFGDDQLNQLEAQALKNSPDAKTQAAKLLEAVATRKSAILQTFPTGDITGGSSRQTEYAVGGAPVGDIFPVGGVT
ncbi:MAG TPA: TolC family protein, partial [Caulobacteraceae bacterium]|nr:TolC family protein [Caulobacteraceae bacterium]